MIALTRSNSGWLFGAALIVAVLLHLWPFRMAALPDLYLNDTVWTPAGALFPRQGLLITRRPPAALQAALVDADALGVEAWISPATLDQGGPARIVSLSDGIGARNFTLGQEGADLVFRLRTLGTDRNAAGRGAVTAEGVLEAGRLQHVAASFDGSGVALFVDGRRVAADTRTGGFATWDPDHRLAVGNETGGERPWRGTIAALALHDRPLVPGPDASIDDRLAAGTPLVAYDFRTGSGDALPGSRIPVGLHRPAVFGPRLGLLGAMPRHPSDVAHSLAIFGVLGALAVLRLQRQGAPAAGAVWRAVLLLAVVALALETLQVFVVGRTSALVDLGGALAGIGAGALLAARLPSGRRR